MITVKEAALQLNGREYREEGNGEFWAALKYAGIVAVFGASDDLMEFRGAINDEVGCYDGGAAYLNDSGLYYRECEDKYCPHEKTIEARMETIKAIFDAEGFTFVYETEIPHETFIIKEGSDNYCRGVVFYLTDVSA
jgi:hypothetical protein